MQQTFIIQDHLPTGQTKNVNLLCPSKPVKGTEDEFTLVSRYFLFLTQLKQTPVHHGIQRLQMQQAA